MSCSNDDEDDFFSADEDDDSSKSSCSTKGDIITKNPSRNNDDLPLASLNELTQVRESDRNDRESHIKETTSSDDSVSNKQSSDTQTENKDMISKTLPTTAIEEDEDDEEALAERIRERNLKLARKFSAEIAKNVKASAPVPVKTSTSSGLRIGDTTIPDSGKRHNSPPAPPPTPALSSSFSNSDEAAALGGTIYSWRVPSKVNQPSLNTQTNDSKISQTKLALDKLSEKLSKSDKNIFEKVAEDLSQVSIKERTKPGESHEVNPIIPSISDLGSTLGGWGWSGASKLLASATQVTSQVGSVLDTLNPHYQLQPTDGQSEPRNTHRTPPSASETYTDKTKNDEAKTSSMSASEAASSSDPLVDFTLNAMESLGKKAFGVMTERDESGSLQIKGLGRPWEHLLNLKGKSQTSPLKDECHPSQEKAFEPVEFTAKLSSNSEHSDDISSDSVLKNRRKRRD